MRFVENQEIPGHVLEGPQDLRALGEVDRGDVDPRKGPRVHVSRPFCCRCAQPYRIGLERAEAELVAELLPPLLAETGRNEDNPTELLASDGKLEQDQAGLHGLAQADGISDQQAGCGVTQDREQRLDLVGEKLR